MKIALLKKVARTILRRPSQVAMSTWFKRKAGAGECGTTACVAGWAITIALAEKNKLKTKPKPLMGAEYAQPGFSRGVDSYLGASSNSKLDKMGQQALGIGLKQSRRLFYAYDWPEKYRRDLAAQIPGSKAYARVVYNRIVHFIKTNGRE
jgi:hypothetical protein